MIWSWNVLIIEFCIKKHLGMNKFEQKGGILIIFLGLFMFSNYFNICLELNNQYFLFFWFIYRMNYQLLQLCAIFLYLIAFVSAAWRPCPELSPALRLPCRCQLESFGDDQQKSSVGMDCDRIVFTSETAQIPLGAPITSFSQRHAGQQALPTQVRIIVCLNLFSNNAIKTIIDERLYLKSTYVSKHATRLFCRS